MANTDRLSVLSTALFDKIKLNKNELGLNDVLYGNQQIIPLDKTCVVNARTKTRTLDGVAGTGGRTRNELLVNVDVHVMRIGDEATERLKVEELAEDIEDLLHNDITVGGIIIHGFVTNTESGDSQFASGSMYRTVRMIYTGITKTNVGP